MPRTDEIDSWLASIKGEVKGGRSSKSCFTERMKVYTPVNCGGINKKCRCGATDVKSGQRCMSNVNELIASINKLFGGSTVYDAKGSGLDEGKLVEEPIKVIEVASNCTDFKTAKEFKEAMVKYAVDMNQWEIGVSRGSQFFINRTAQASESLREKQITLEKY